VGSELKSREAHNGGGARGGRFKRGTVRGRETDERMERGAGGEREREREKKLHQSENPSRTRAQYIYSCTHIVNDSPYSAYVANK